MAPLPESFALCCRPCGAPRSPREAECAHCGSTERPDAATLARLRAHRARMRRALQQLRAIGTARVATVLLRGKLPWLLGLFLGLPILSFLVAVAVLLFCLAIGGTDGPLALAGAFAATAIGTLGSWAGIVLAYRLYKRVAAHAAAEAQEIVLGIAATMPAVCPQCGGHAAVVAGLGGVGPLPLRRRCSPRAAPTRRSPPWPRRCSPATRTSRSASRVPSWRGCGCPRRCGRRRCPATS